MARGRRMRALRSMARQDLAQRKWDSIIDDYSRIKKTPRRGTSGRSAETMRYNTALRVLQTGNPWGTLSGASRDIRMDENTPGIKQAQKCMKNHMMKGKDIRGAYNACGLSDKKSWDAGSAFLEEKAKITG